MNRRIGILRKAGEGGFTMLELLIAMAVAALLMVSLLSILSKSMEISKGANASILSRSAAQAALDLMVTDLDSLVISRNAGEVLSVQRGELTNSSLTLLTTSMVDSYSTNWSGSPGMPRVVQYAVRYSKTDASRFVRSFGLYRNVMDPATTFSSAIGGNNLGSGAIFSNNPLVPNVVKMNVNLYTNYGSGAPWSVTSINSTNFPPGVVVEVALTVLDEPYIQRFGDGTGSGNNSAENLIRQYGRTLIRRVMLHSPL